MKLIFFKARYGGVWSRLVALRTWGPYSHCELVLHPEEGLCVSADPDVGKVRMARIDYHREQWGVVDLSPLSLDQQAMRRFCLAQLGQPYDWRAIWLTFFLPFKSQNPENWFCSELCLRALQIGGYSWPRKPSTVHPNKLYRKVSRACRT